MAYIEVHAHLENCEFLQNQPFICEPLPNDEYELLYIIHVYKLSLSVLQALSGNVTASFGERAVLLFLKVVYTDYHLHHIVVPPRASRRYVFQVIARASL